MKSTIKNWGMCNLPGQALPGVSPADTKTFLFLFAKQFHLCQVFQGIQ
jgi:hypothetical protein